LEVIDDRSRVRSTLVVSQLPVDAWHPALAGGDPTLADAILDRLVQHAHRLPLTGESDWIICNWNGTTSGQRCAGPSTALAPR